MIKTIFSREPSDIKYISKSLLKYIIEVAKDYRYWFIIDFALIMLLSYSKLIVPVIFSNFIGYISDIKISDFSWLKSGHFLLMIFIALIMANIIRFFREMLETNIRGAIRWKIKKYSLTYVEGHSEEYLSNQKSGVLAERINSCASYTNWFLFAISRFISTVFLIGISFYFIARVNLVFLALVIIFGMFSSGFSYYMSKKLNKISKKVANQNSKLSGSIADSISNVLLVKIFGQAKYEQEYIKNEINEATSLGRLEALTREKLDAIQNAIVFSLKIIVLIVSLIMLSSNKIDIANIVLILLLIDDVLQYFTRFMWDILQLQEVSGKLKSSLEPLVTKHDMIDDANAKELRVKKGVIKFENIVFSYNKRKKIFNKLNLEINAGEKIGVVGVSGSGKTTLINLLQRYYFLNSGRILIDNQDIAKITQSSLHSSIALIPQESILFHRSIAQNIAYGKPGATPQQVIKAAKKAYADEFIKDLIYGYQTIVGERGVKLSGGQRQRVSIARAVLKDSKILILDEATSALDNESEEKISKSLDKIMQNKTVIAIAHRLSTLQKMDRIIVIDNGVIIEDGSPKELIDAKGVFAKTWKLQTQSS